MVAPPSVAANLDDWRRASDRTETLFAAGGFSVEARVQVYEDDRLRATVRDQTGVDRSWRFFLVARLELTPSPPVTGALRGLVASRASRGFTDRLEDRGFDAVERVERRTLRVGDDEARLFGYDARCLVEGLSLSVDGWLAVWVPDDAFRLAGGAYPTSIDGEGPTADALADALDPAAFRSALFELVRATG